MLQPRILQIALLLLSAVPRCFGLNASDWQVRKADDAQVDFLHDTVKIRAKENSHALLARSAPTNELFRVTCEIFPTYSRNHANGILLFWDDQNWIRFAVVRLDVSDYGGWFAHKGGGYYLINRMTGGQYTEEVLGTCAGAQPHRLAIELAQDALRFMIMAKMETWVNYKLEFRPEPLKNRKPQRILLGKIGIDPANPGKAFEKDFAFSAADPGPEVVSELSHISITETPTGRKMLTELEKKELLEPGIDHLGQIEISKPDDPTFDSVRQYFPDMKFYREAIGIKDHPQDIGVGFDGALEFKDRCVSAYWMDPAPDTGFFTANGLRLGRDVKIIKRYLLDGDWPAVVCEFATPGIKYTQTVFGFSEGASLTNDLFGYCSLEVLNQSSEDKAFQIKYSVAPERLSWTFSLPPGERSTLYLRAPFDRAGHKAEPLDKQDFRKALKEARACWAGLFEKSFKVEIPEKRVADAFKAWQAYAFINVDKRDGRYFICDGTGFYNEIYGYSACIYIRALLRLGYFEAARTYLTNQLQFVRDDGLFLLNFGVTDTGTYLRAFADYYRYTRDRATMAGVLPQIKKMVGWIVKQRATSQTANPATSGLLHVRPYADHPEPTYAYLTDTYLCKGLEEASFILSQLGDSAAEEVMNQARAYRMDILRSMDHAIVEKDGLKLLPMMPESDGQFKKSNSKADDYYGSNCSMLLEIDFLDPRGSYADLLVNVLEKRGGKAFGALAWRRGIDHAYLYGYQLNCLQRNRPREAILALYGWMAYGMTRNTYSATEVTYHRLGDNCATLPHTYSCSEQIRLLLDMLVRPEGDQLYLAQAIPDAWLQAGKTVAVEQAPTPFGEVSYRIKVSDSGLKAHIELAKDAKVKQLHLGLRPFRRKVDGVLVNKQSLKVENGLLTITQPERKTVIEATWK